MRWPSGPKFTPWRRNMRMRQRFTRRSSRAGRRIQTWDVYSPFPVHGMDDAMGLGKSWLSAVVLTGGITGLFTAVILNLVPPGSFIR